MKQFKKEPQLYGDDFFKGQNSAARTSADVIVPLVMDAVGPKSVVDVGCGRGAWTLAFSSAGCQTASIDGPWTDMSELTAAGLLTHRMDLSQPIQLDETFDLAVCLEVAEHLDRASANALVSSLCKLAPVVLFSAAFPGQRGTHHVNEQLPSWWVDLFAQCDRVPHDLVRPRVWNDPTVAYWYAQNTLLFVPRDHPLAAYPPGITDVVHPRMYRVAQNRLTSVRDVARELPQGMFRTAKRRVAAAFAKRTF